MPTYYAQITYTGNGSTTSFAIPFPYIDSFHVKAYINGTINTDFTISTSTLIFNTAPANGATIRIERQTPLDARLVDFQDGSVLTEADLDKSANQSFYIAQEVADDSVNNMAVDVDDKWDAKSKIIKNLASPVNDNDAVNKAFITTNLPAINTVNTNIASVATVASNIANVNAVNSNSANINSVASNSANINSAVSNATNINAVVSNSVNINTAAGANANITAVASQITPTNNIGTLAGLATQITGVYNIRNDVTAVNSNSANINSVASNITAVTGVNSNSTNINAVNSNSANINTVAGQITPTNKISTVAGIASDVSTVAGISSNVTSVAGNATNINTVASNNSNINTVAGIASNVSTVAGISSAVSTVAGISSKISAVEAKLNEVQTVANDLNETISEIDTVAQHVTNIDTVGTNIANVNNVAGNSININAVNSNSANINLVAGSITNVNNVGNNITNVNAVNSNSSNINAVVSNATNINSVASNIANVNNVGNSISAVNTVSGNLAGINSFNERYRISATAPTTSLDIGDLWYDSTSSNLRVYTANGWQIASDYIENLVNDYKYDITGSPSYVEGASNNANAAVFDYAENSLVNVFVNGLRIIPTADYTLSKNNNVARVTFNSPLVNGDVVYIQVFRKLQTVEEQILQGYVSTTLGYKNTTEGFKNTTEGYKNSAQTSATNSANSATASANSATASQNSATASAASAASSLQSLNSFNAAYTYGTTPPNNPDNGAIWFDTSTTRLKVYVALNNIGWVNAGTYVEGLITNYTYIATQGQTVFTGNDIDNKSLSFNATGNVFVFVNGIRITPTSDYVLSNSNRCTLTVAANAGDVIYIEVIQKISLTEEQLLQSYVASALADKNTATTQAGIATTQAGIATTQATNASASAASALTSKNNAATSEANALSYRNTTEGYKNDAQTAKTAAEAAAALATVGGGAFKITANDTTANVFNLKVSVGNGITKTLNNAGGNESVTLSLPFTETVITPTNGQTVFNTTYVVNFVQVYVNGVKLIKGVDFTATNGTTITLNDALLSNDVVEIVKFA